MRWIIGGLTILTSWPYDYYVLAPVSIWLCAIPPEKRLGAGAQVDAGLGFAGVGLHPDRIGSLRRIWLGAQAASVIDDRQRHLATMLRESALRLPAPSRIRCFTSIYQP
ncbi:hypothetical protein QA645_07280 [Bradyrhizobium sp. CIAT3101]|uniref:hypothetical protein n=1 Tax=Bradyrhizobium sp. CIAT3101 TaxID=439387 RepID=UPI0024B1FD7C|nr:hypothetical protein [Bradyrhizobium sp. CIAT3101]WFU82537.1 hypothetical protein QA645_07280 [Bradyrhizobium sp. CIAT3101]